MARRPRFFVVQNLQDYKKSVCSLFFNHFFFSLLFCLAHLDHAKEKRYLERTTRQEMKPFHFVLFRFVSFRRRSVSSRRRFVSFRDGSSRNVFFLLVPFLARAVLEKKRCRTLARHLSRGTGSGVIVATVAAEAVVASQNSPGGRQA